MYWWWNGLVCQVKTLPEILFIYIAHLVIIVHKTSAANKFARVWKNYLKMECKVQIYATVRACEGSALSSDTIFTGVIQLSVHAMHW
jgi:CRISPR/Cas system-associated protein Csm6